MATQTKVQRDGIKGTHEPARNGAEEVSPVERDRLQRVAGASWRTVEGKRERIADALEVDPSQVTRRKDGMHPSRLSRACEAVYVAALESRKLEEAGIVSAFVDATLKSVAMRPTLEHLTTPELVRLLEDTYDEETMIEGQLNVLQRRRSAGKTVDVNKERDLWTRQAAFSERAMAILDILADRPDYVG